MAENTLHVNWIIREPAGKMVMSMFVRTGKNYIKTTGVLMIIPMEFVVQNSVLIILQQLVRGLLSGETDAGISAINAVMILVRPEHQRLIKGLTVIQPDAEINVINAVVRMGLLQIIMGSQREKLNVELVINVTILVQRGLSHQVVRQNIMRYVSGRQNVEMHVMNVVIIRIVMRAVFLVPELISVSITPAGFVLPVIIMLIVRLAVSIVSMDVGDIIIVVNALSAKNVSEVQVMILIERWHVWMIILRITKKQL